MNRTPEIRERTLLLLAISIAIEHETRALEYCYEHLCHGFFAERADILQRQRTLNELLELRQGLLVEMPQEPKKPAVEPKIGTCAFCKGEFVVVRAANQIYCSSRCRKNAGNRRLKPAFS